MTKQIEPYIPERNRKLEKTLLALHNVRKKFGLKVTRHLPAKTPGTENSKGIFTVLKTAFIHII